MRTNVNYSEITNELYNIFSDDKSAAAYMADSFGPQYIGLCGWAGAMSPANRAAFVQTFGRDVTDRAEAEARARVDEYRAAVAASAYHRHELEADAFAAYGGSEKSQLPEVGAFVWCQTNGMKCENGPADPLQDFAEGGELGKFRRRLVEIVAAVDLPAAEFLTAEAAHRVAADHQETGGSRYEEADPLRLDGLPMSWTTGVLVRCGARWYVVDSEGYNWARYVLMPDNMGEMYAAELADFRAAYEAREAEKAAEERRQAEARRADYLKRCARWAPLMEDVRPLMEAERVAYGSREKSQIRKASAKLAAARRRNLVAMASALYPGVKFSAKKWEGWGGSYELTWTDGPTEEHLKEAADFHLFESGRDTFDGMTDCAGVEYSEFGDFAEKYFGLFGQIRMDRNESEDFRQTIADRIRAAVPGLPEGDQEPIKRDGGQLSAICGMFPDVRASYIVQNLDRYGLRDAVAYLARCLDATPTQQDEPTDPNGGGSPTPSYGDGEKSQLQDAPTVEGVEVVGYSEKALAVFGDTRALADELKAIGAKFNRALSYNGERRAGWIISRRKADELAALLAVPQTQETEAAPALPEPPAAVVYDPAQPIECAEFVAVDAEGAAYGEGEKSQNPEAVEVSERPDVKEYKLMYLFGAWVCHSRVYAETDAEAIHDATDDFMASRLPRWPYRVALWEGSRLVHEFKGNGPDDIGRRDMEQEESENAPAYIVHDTTAGPFAFEDYATGSILAAVDRVAKNEHTANPHPLQLFADGVKVWDREEHPTEYLSHIVRQRLAESYGVCEKSQLQGSMRAEAQREEVRDWYMFQYPTDEEGANIQAGATFADIMANPARVYDYIPSDSIIRERVFRETANRYGVEYSDIYRRWMDEEGAPSDSPKGESCDADGAAYGNGEKSLTEDRIAKLANGSSWYDADTYRMMDEVAATYGLIPVGHYYSGTFYNLKDGMDKVKNSEGETFVIQVQPHFDEHVKTGNPQRWLKAGYTRELITDWWHIDTYCTTEDGKCYGGYNPTVKYDGKRLVIDFDWLLPVTRDNLHKLLSEVIRRFYGNSQKSQNAEPPVASQE